MKFGIVRVSSVEQNIDQQEMLICALKADKAFSDKDK